MTRSPRPSSRLVFVSDTEAEPIGRRRLAGVQAREPLDWSVPHTHVRRQKMAEETRSQSSTASKVQEAAANIHQPTTRKRIARSEHSEAEKVAREYFAAISARELEAALAMWVPEGSENVHGQGQFSGREGLREFIGSLLDALPD